MGRQWRSILALMLLASTAPLAASAADQHPWCGTSPETTAKQERLARWVQAKQRLKGETSGLAFGGPVRFENNMFIMQSDETVAPFDRPVDLHNSSLYFDRIDASRFNVRKTALVWNESVAPWTSLSSPPTYATRAISFNFPFFASTYNSVNVSSTKGLYFATPPTTSMDQYDAIAAIYQRVPVIAPLLESTSENWKWFDVLVHEVNGVSITFNWRVPYTDSEFGEDIQVTLFSDGDIRMSYKTVGRGSWGTVLVTSGNEPFYSARTAIMSGNDAAGDVHTDVPPSIRPMVDLQVITLQRVSNTDLLELRLTLGATLDTAALAPGSYVSFNVLIGANDDERGVNAIYASIHQDGQIEYYFPNDQWLGYNPPTATLNANVLALVFPEDALVVGSLQSRIDVYATYSAGNWSGDSSSTNFTFNVATKPFVTDLSRLNANATPLSGPIVEPFRLPSLNVDGIWQRLRAAYGFTDDEIDQVAIYPRYYTDIVFWAGAYSTVGNSGDDGVQYGSNGSSYPRRPAFMHMNTLGYGWNSWPEGLLHVRTHEFGHRWLYFLRIRENGVDTSSLNPSGAHPKRGVHIPAAANVITSTDSSAMGGGYFTQVGPMQYQTGSDSTYYGYSWHELYLMGLAAANEVPSWYYLNGAGLEEPYYAFTNTTYDVTARTNVTQQQLIDAMGPRVPSYATSRKAFKEIVVLLERASDPIPQASLGTYETSLVTGFQNHFSAITMGRGSVVTVTSPLNQPANVVATATSTNSILVTWDLVPAASSYQIWRSSNGEDFVQVGTTSGASFPNTVSPDTTYLYKVRSVFGGSSLSAFSATDLATTVVFTDDPLVTGTTRVKAAHVTQLRTAVNAVRAAAGLPAVTFTGTVAVSGSIQAGHVIELRGALEPALEDLGAPGLTDVNGIVGGGTVLVRGLDLQQIRDAVR